MNQKVQCELCPRECIIAPGQSGDCRVRINIDGVLRTVVYGYPCSINIDPVEKKPLFHFLKQLVPLSPLFYLKDRLFHIHFFEYYFAALQTLFLKSEFFGI